MTIPRRCPAPTGVARQGERGLRAFGPARRGPFVSAKGPKTMGAHARLSSGAFAPVPKVWAAELASLRQSSPPTRFRDWGAALRPQAPPEVAPWDGAGRATWRTTTLDPRLLMSRMTERESLRGFGPARRRGGSPGFRPRTPRSFCFGKRTQNHRAPRGPRVPLPRSRKVWAAELASLRQSSPPTRFRDWGAAWCPQAP